MLLPTTQKAIVIHENGGPEVLKYEDILVPQIKDSEILIKNKYAGINFLESYYRTGLYQSIKPYILGREASGDLNEEGFKIYGSVLLQSLTALTFVNEAYDVLKDDYILVHAAGGVGLILDQLISLRGANVIGTVSTLEKSKLAKDNGVGYIIDSTNKDIVSKVLEITNGNGVAAVFDGVCKSTFDISLKFVAIK